jgi:hypothetical protein
MSPADWLQRVCLQTVSSLPKRMRSRAARSISSAVRRCVEAEILEGRTVYSATLAVNTFVDQSVSFNGTLSLREALEQAVSTPSAVTIDVPAGTYDLALGALSMPSADPYSITVIGQGTNAGNTIIAAQGGSAVFTFPAGTTVTLEDLTANTGGGIYSMYGGTLNGVIVAADTGSDLASAGSAFSGSHDLIGDGSGGLAGPTIHSGVENSAGALLVGQTITLILDGVTVGKTVTAANGTYTLSATTPKLEPGTYTKAIKAVFASDTDASAATAFAMLTLVSA